LPATWYQYARYETRFNQENVMPIYMNEVLNEVLCDGSVRVQDSPLLNRLRTLFGARLNINFASPQLINFWVMDQTDVQAMRTLEGRSPEVFPEGLYQYQITTPLQPIGGRRGITVRQLSTPQLDEYRSGFWYT
jgi:hypothetical protein